MISAKISSNLFRSAKMLFPTEITTIAGHPTAVLAASIDRNYELVENINSADVFCFHQWKRTYQRNGLHVPSNYSNVTIASFSSSVCADDGSSKRGVVRGWMEDRQARQEQEKFMEQMNRLSTIEVFTLDQYQKELKIGLESSSMLSKISFMHTKEYKQAKEVINVVDKIINIVGPDATAEDLINLNRLERLRVANAANKTLEEIAIMVSQITNMDVMQKTLRKRYIEGKPLPPNKEAIEAVVQKDALSVLSKSQKEMMKTRQKKHAQRMARKKRR